MLGNLGVFGSRGILLLLLRHLNMVVEKRGARMMARMMGSGPLLV